MNSLPATMWVNLMNIMVKKQVLENYKHLFSLKNKQNQTILFMGTYIRDKTTREIRRLKSLRIKESCCLRQMKEGMWEERAS